MLPYVLFSVSAAAFMSAAAPSLVDSCDENRMCSVTSAVSVGSSVSSRLLFVTLHRDDGLAEHEPFASLRVAAGWQRSHVDS